MRKLEKLTLKELCKSTSVLDLNQVSKLRGGDGSGDYPYYCPGESYCYGGPGGAAARALMEVGNCEINGSTNTSHIMSYFTSCAGSFTNHDSWCSAFVNSMYQASGMQGTDSARSDSWLNWGTATTEPHVGDVAVYRNGGHCGIVTSVENGVVMVTAGNSGNQDCVSTSQWGDWVFRTGGN